MGRVMDSFTIDRLGHQGDGIAPGPVFAPRTLPGETVSGVLDGQRLTEIRIDTPSADRVRPPCRHYKSCGGCQLQHASDDFVAAWKQSVVAQALEAQGLSAPIRGIATSPARSRRRAAFSVRRTKKGVLMGFHAPASDQIVEIPDCLLVDPVLLSMRDVAQDLARAGGSRKGEMTMLTTRSEAGLDLAVSGGKPLDRALEVALAQLAQTHDLARLAWDGEVIAMRRPPYQSFGRAQVVPPPGAFLQATREGEAALLAAVKEAVGPAKTIVDLFAGCGTFALPLSEQADLHAVEGAADMVTALDTAWRKTPNLHQLSHEARDLFRRPLLPDELARFDAAVIDPPRAGAEAQVAELARARVGRIAMVSCNPVTFARDAKTLAEAGYRLNWVQVVDQFRWSSHVELVASLTAAHIGDA